MQLIDLDQTEWIEQTVCEVYYEAMSGDEQAAQTREVWVDGSLAVPLSKIKAFLGDSEIFDGGSILMSIVQPDYLASVEDSLKHTCLKLLGVTDAGIKTMANYVWHTYIKDKDW